MPEAISEKIVEKLPIPDAGNKVHFFSGSTLQGKKAPAGFGVRVTAGGTKSFVLFHRVDGRWYITGVPGPRSWYANVRRGGHQGAPLTSPAIMPREWNPGPPAGILGTRSREALQRAWPATLGSRLLTQGRLP